MLVPPIVPQHGLHRGGKVVPLSGVSMGTTWRLAYCDQSVVDQATVLREVQARLDQVVAQMSTWLPTSKISIYNSAPGGSEHVLPPEFVTVLATALEVAERTGGAFDPTIGPLVDLWGFGSGGQGHRTPEPEEIAAARELVGWRRAVCNVETKRLTQLGGTKLDLSSIAKGFGVDEMARCLDHIGVSSYLCEIGGELRGSGCKPDGSPWWVSLETPPDTADSSETFVALCGKAVATSGDYVRRFVKNGRSYGHTIDPRTGMPLEHSLVSVSVVGDDCMTADALATALLVMGLEAGFDFAEQEDIAARFVHGSGATTASSFSPALSKYFQ